MFKALLNKGILFRRILEAFDEVVSDVTLQVSPRGLEIKEKDSEGVALIWLVMEAHGFD